MLMRALRQLSPFVWIMGVSGLLLCGASLALSTRQLLLFQQSYPGIPVDIDRMMALSMGLGQLGIACMVSAWLCNIRMRKAAPGPLPPGAPRPADSWKLRLVTLLVPGTLPLSLIVLAFVIPSTSRFFGVTFAVQIAGGLVLLGSIIWVIVRSIEALSDPRLRQWRQYRMP